MSKPIKANASYPAIFAHMTFLLWPPQVSAVQKLKKSVFERYGARIVDSEAASVTHILVNNAQVGDPCFFKQSDTRVIVEEKWANDSIDQKKALDVYPYVLRSRKRRIEHDASGLDQRTKSTPSPEPKIHELSTTDKLPKRRHVSDTRATESSNELLIQTFSELATERQNSGNEFSGRAYLRAVKKLQACATPIHSYGDAKEIGLSPKLSQLVDDICKGKIPDTVREDTREKSQVISLFQTLYGVGPKVAAHYYQLGYRTLDDIKRNVKTPSVLVSLEHQADLIERISRLEVSRHFEVVKAALLDTADGATAFCMGSYRRSEPDCGDIDIIVTKPGCEKKDIKKIVTKLVNELYDRGFAKYTFGGGTGSRRWLGAASLENGKWRRVDILGVPNSELGAAFIYYTGNEMFNRMLRLRAQRMGMHLNERGLFNGASEELLESRDEKRIFELLKVPWREPTDRVIL